MKMAPIIQNEASGVQEFTGGCSEMPDAGPDAEPV